MSAGVSSEIFGDGGGLVYHEVQVAALCGRHAINNLLQGEYCDEVRLAEIARTLDARERELMLEAGAESAEALAFLSADSGNVDDAGNFSISVLQEYLEREHSVGLDAEVSAVARAAAAASDGRGGDDVGLSGGGSSAGPVGSAFLLNLKEHWFSIRRLHGRWFDLNSLLPMPRVLSDTHLDAFLSSMRQEGYIVFAVTGALPPAPTHRFERDGVQKVHTVAEILASGVTGRSSAAEARKRAAQSARIEASNDPDMAAALRASLVGAGYDDYDDYLAATGGAKRARAIGAAEDEDNDLQRALVESRAHVVASSSDSALARVSSTSAPAATDADDAELSRAIAMSLENDAAMAASSTAQSSATIARPLVAAPRESAAAAAGKAARARAVAAAAAAAAATAAVAAAAATSDSAATSMNAAITATNSEA